MDWDVLATRVISGGEVTRGEARAVVEAPAHETFRIVAAAERVRRHHWGDQVHLHLLMNAQSGLCPEDCGYCSQSSRSTASIDKYPLRPQDEILEGAARAAELGCTTYCIVMSGRGPTRRAVEEVCAATREIKARHGLKVCACLGLLEPDQAEALAAAGVDRYNHNLNTSAAHSPQVVTTHTYEDRVRTVQNAIKAGLSPCSGAIFGMKESAEDRVDVAFALRDLGAESIPVNFLHPIPGTPLEDKHELDPLLCLRILAMVRLVNPEREIRVAGGREVNLRSLQPLALLVANSIFAGDYLTTAGALPEEDVRMIEDLGLTVAPQARPVTPPLASA